MYHQDIQLTYGKENKESKPQDLWTIGSFDE